MLRLSISRLPDGCRRTFDNFISCSSLPTIPNSHLIVYADTSTQILTPLSYFFTSFWAAIDGRALSSLDRAATSAAFLSSLLECTAFLARRLRNDTGDHAVLVTDIGNEDTDQVSGIHGASRLVGQQFSRVWNELAGHRLKVQLADAGKLMAQTLASLQRIDEGEWQKNY